MTRFNWDKLPRNIRLGSSPDEILTLYRGLKPDQIDPERGMLSMAEQTGALSSIEALLRAIEEEDRVTLDKLRHAHLRDMTKRTTISPFVSACEDWLVAVKYARGRENTLGLVATFDARADELMRAPFPCEYETYVLGGVALDRLTLEEVVATPQSVMPTGVYDLNQLSPKLTLNL
jgi:hypothetical protein